MLWHRTLVWNIKLLWPIIIYQKKGLNNLKDTYSTCNQTVSRIELIIEKIKEILGDNSGLKYQIQGVYGIYDIVLKVSSDDGPKLRKMITTEMHPSTIISL